MTALSVLCAGSGAIASTFMCIAMQVLPSMCMLTATAAKVRMPSRRTTTRTPGAGQCERWPSA